jgi:hypothetical protein
VGSLNSHSPETAVSLNIIEIVGLDLQGIAILLGGVIWQQLTAVALTGQANVSERLASQSIKILKYMPLIRCSTDILGEQAALRREAIEVIRKAADAVTEVFARLGLIRTERRLMQQQHPREPSGLLLRSLRHAVTDARWALLSPTVRDHNRRISGIGPHRSFGA